MLASCFGMLYTNRVMAYSCYVCGKDYPFDTRSFVCSCGGFFQIKEQESYQEKKLRKHDRTIWKYRDFFGLPDDLSPVSLGEGFTPLIHRTIDGSPLSFKLDYMQPTGSFKDRGASVLLSVVKYLDVSEVVEDSSGNAGAAVSAYSAAAGIGCRVYVPEYTPDGKLTQMRLYGAKVVKVSGTRQDASNAVLKASKNAYYASHLYSPYFIMGLKSAAYEIWESLGRKSPKLAVVPLGSGGFLEGLFLGFKSLADAGYADHIPKMVGIQAEKCSPIHTALIEGLDDYADIDAEVTLAEGIAVRRPPRAKAVIGAIRETKGFTLSVTEEEILNACTILFSMGIFVEPTSAAVLAGWIKMEPQMRKNAVLMLTGSGLKETNKLMDLFS